MTTTMNHADTGSLSLDETDHAWTIYESPLGPLTLVAGPAGLTKIHFPGSGALDDAARRSPRLDAAVDQLEQYFAGRRQVFELALDIGGTPFQRRVWRRLQRIPFGSTTSYSRIARAIGHPAAVRAVAAAVGRTPVPIIVPCHRVLAADGALTGYRGGLQRKAALLELEAGGAAGD